MIYTFVLSLLVSCKSDDYTTEMPEDMLVEPSNEETDTSSENLNDTGTTNTVDTGESEERPVEECTLQVTIQSIQTASGTVFSFDSVPAQTDSITIELHLYNPCEQSEIRFLGVPTEWIEGTGFTLDTLPPILLYPQESSQLSLLFTPGDEGTYTGVFSLPYNHPAAPFDLNLSATVTAPLSIVLVGDGFSTVTHDYGVTWTDTIFSNEIHSNEVRRGACWGMGHFYAIGGSDEAKIWSSQDGHTWTEYNPHTGWLADCAYGNDMVFVAGGFHWIHQSSDSQSWYEGGDFGGHLRTVTFGNDLFLAAGDEQVAISHDGTSWTQIHDHGINQINDIKFGNNLFVAVGDNGSVLTSSDNGVSWTHVSIDSGNIEAITFHNGMFYLGDGAVIYQSSNGIAWTLTNGATNVIPRAFIGRTMYGTSTNAFFESTDNGFSWEELYSWSSINGFNDIAVEGF